MKQFGQSKTTGHLTYRSDGADELLDKVVAGGYCIGCGVCSSVEGSPLSIKMDRYRCFQAELELASTAQSSIDLMTLCPFSDRSDDETTLAKKLFAWESMGYVEGAGYSLGAYAGYVAEGKYRANGSSGGLATWVLVELLQHGLVEGVIHVRPCEPTDDDNRLFRYSVSRTAEEVRAGAKSRYYSVELSEVLKQIDSTGGKYAIVGVPCFIRAVRLLCQKDQRYAERIAFCLALFCGHLKSARFADLFAWQAGIEPGKLSWIDFRKKLSGTPPSHYCVEMAPRGSNESIVRPWKDFYGIWWGHSFLKYTACDYCDDIVGEVADISLGDAWLPEYLEDSGGTSIAILRNPVLAQILEDGIRSGRLHLEPMLPERAVESQISNFRHRREGLSYRLCLKDQAGAWRPRKRVEARSDHITGRRREIYRKRVELTEKSHECFAAAAEHNDFNRFRLGMEPLVQHYQDHYRSWWRKWASRGKRLILHLVDSTR